MKFYIAGKITGLHPDVYKARFLDAHMELISIGVKQIENPIYFGLEPETETHEALKVCLPILEECDAIYMMNNWTDSYGAIQELKHARKHGIMEFFQSRDSDLDRIQKELARRGIIDT